MAQLFLLFLCLLLCPLDAIGADNRLTAPVLPLGFSYDSLSKLYTHVVRTGLGWNSIPAIDRPQFLTVSDASLSLNDDDVVFIVHYPTGHVRIYPQRILVWHEAINDTLPDKSGGTPIPGSDEAAGLSYTVTYSPLTGSIVAFRSLAGRYPSNFATTGDLLNNNSVLYDRVSGSEWSQILGICLDGALQGNRLQRIPVLWGTWGGVKKRYLGKALVLSRATGHRRNYGKDPYGSYQLKGTYYDNSQLVHSTVNIDTRLPFKRKILGLELENLTAALQINAVKEQKFYNFTFGFMPMVALYDEEIDAVRVFQRRLTEDAMALEFTILEDQFVDKETKSRWSADGKCTYGKLRDNQLIPVYTLDSMWFAWASFHKNTLIFPPLHK